MAKRHTYLLLLLLAGTLQACMAKYHTVRKDKDGLSEIPSGDDAIPGSLGPNAELEILINGSAQVQARPNQVFTAQPTIDTLDGDDKDDMDTCRNPGIIRAVFVASNGDTEVVERDDCSILAWEHKFTKPGFYTISMIVFSDEEEKAEASSTLWVLEDNKNTLGGFTIQATPLITEINQDIRFTSECKIGGHNVIWKFADGTEVKAETTTRSFDRAGPQVVHATCISTDQKVKLTASLTVLITGDSNIPGGTSGGNGTGGKGSGTTGGDTGGKNSGDTNGGKDTGSSSGGDDKSGTSDGGTGSSDGGGSTDGGGSSSGDGGDGGSTSGKDPGKDPGTDSGQDPGQYPGQNPGQNPGQF